uniref:Uncharacterized protein n=1 Tax=Alexandrium monilatum TaxID=311494 RepID=A0A7S4UBS2_9DINO
MAQVATPIGLKPLECALRVSLIAHDPLLQSQSFPTTCHTLACFSMAHTPVMLGFLATILLACLTLAQALAPGTPAAMEVASSISTTADANSSMAVDWIEVLHVKEVAGLLPPGRLPSDVLSTDRTAAAVEELVDELPGAQAMASPARLSFAWRCCLDAAVILLVAIRLKPWDCKAAPVGVHTGGPQLPCRPKHNADRADAAAQRRGGRARGRDLLFAWDSFA